MSIALLVVAALTASGTLLSIARTGKPREALTPGDAAAVTVICAAIVVVEVLAALRIGLP